MRKDCYQCKHRLAVEESMTDEEARLAGLYKVLRLPERDPRPP